jgi:hypothetical protein
MPILEKTIRVAAILLAVLFIVLSFAGTKSPGLEALFSIHQ